MLARRLRLAVPAVPPPVTNRMADWCVHEFREDRYRWVIFCHTASLYPLVVHARGLNDEAALIQRAMDAMRLCFVGTDLEFLYQRSIVPELGAVQFAPIPDRSVLASVNEFIVHARYGLREQRFSPPELAAWLAQIPMKTIGMNSPDRAFPSMAR